MEVVYLGLRQTAEMVVTAVEQEDADAVGISMHNAGHLTLAPRIVDALRDAGLDVPVVVGGIVPESDLEAMAEAGVAGVLGPGASAEDVAACVRGSGHPWQVKTQKINSLVERASEGDRRSSRSVVDSC